MSVNARLESGKRNKYI